MKRVGLKCLGIGGSSTFKVRSLFRWGMDSRNWHFFQDLGNKGVKLRIKVGCKLYGKVGIDVLLQFLFHVVHFGLDVGSDAVFKVLVVIVGHGEGKKQEEVGNIGVWKGRVGPQKKKMRKNESYHCDRDEKRSPMG
jgi:hypothetical protein